MGKDSKIAWTDHTFNPWWGCVRVSPGCVNCYAEAFARRTGHDVWGAGAPRRFFGDAHWREPLRWNEAARRARRRTRVFCASMCDVFEADPRLVDARGRLWALVAETPALEWLLLTKRPQNVAGMAPAWWLHRWPDNVRLGVTCEDQPRADERLAVLSALGAPNFVSAEPLLGPVTLRLRQPGERRRYHRVDWVIAGGESGVGARPMDAEWARALLEECRDAGAAFFMKQMGSLAACAHDAKGGCLACMPEDLRVREFPRAGGGGDEGDGRDEDVWRDDG